MNTFIQLVVKFFLRLLNPKAKSETKPTSTSSKPKPKPTPAPPPAAAPTPTPQPASTPTEPLPTPTVPIATGPLAPDAGLEFTEQHDGSGRKLKAIVITDGQETGKFSRYTNSSRGWEGWYTGGKRPIHEFIQAEEELLKDLEMSKSSQNLLQAVSENEGKLEAINAYDGAFLSFGIFQWTLGTRDNVGELPALLKKLKETYPDTFQQYFGRYGIGIGEETNGLTGYITLNDQLINTRALKEQFRSKEWVYRFWRAGLDPKVQAIEVQHALSRLNSFYWRYKVHGHTLNKIITSEYGVALLLDNHVNLPGLVRRALRAAMNETGLKDPTNWGTEEERKVLDAYIKHRATRVEGVGPMYDAINRAKRTAAYLNKQVISDERGSFRFTDTRSRSMENHVPMPRGLNQDDYPDLEEAIDLEGRDMEFLARSEHE